MTNARQYVACVFRPGDKRTYTYHFDGEPLAVDDKVVVTTNRGPSTVTVVSVSDTKPSFETKPIVGKERPVAQFDRAELGIDGNAGFALLGPNIQEGEAEFVEVPPEDGVRSQHDRECWAATQAFNKLKERLGRPLSYFIGPSHPNHC